MTFSGKLAFTLVVFALTAAAQEKPPADAKPKVRVNYLNVCSPSDVEKSELAAALERLPAKPRFGVDFEVSRGRSTMTGDNLLAAGENAQMSGDAPSVSRWVRIRREFPDASPLSNVQYSFSVTEPRAVETLVFRLRDPKELMQVSISDTVDVTLDAAQIVRANTPADRIRLERFGKSSIVLARCPNADQSAFEPLLQRASSLLAAYRSILGATRVVSQELPRLTDSGKAEPKPKPKR